MSNDQWQQHFSKQKSSGLTVRKYCRQNNLQEPKFYKMRKQLIGSASSRFNEVVINNVTASKALSINIKLNGDGTIEFSGHAAGLDLLEHFLGRRSL